MKIKICLFLVLLLNFVVVAQPNLVTNSSFENLSNCPCCGGEIDYALGWTDPRLAGLGESDLFSSCQSNITAATPYNRLGYQTAHGGSNYAGIAAFWVVTPLNNFVREYIQNSLIDTMSSTIYYFSFYVSLADSANTAIGKLGVLFSDTLVTTVSDSNIAITPSYENNYLLDDKVNWMKVEGKYEAHGGEKYMLIGSFRSNSNIDTTYIGGGSILAPSYYKTSYYFIDDVTVMPDSIVGITEMDTKIQVSVFPNPAQNYITVSSLLDKKNELSFELFDVMGNLLLKEKLLGNTTNVSTENLPNGLYFYKISSANNCYRRDKLMIVK